MSDAAADFPSHRRACNDSMNARMKMTSDLSSEVEYVCPSFISKFLGSVLITEFRMEIEDSNSYFGVFLSFGFLSK
jgi:hypothetical protein